jgi:membrane protein implicated in regulation of membrane protease activity
MTTVQTVWLMVALLLMAGEMAIPEMFLLWLGFAALGVFAVVLGAPDLPIIWQGVAFAAFSALSIFVYLKFVRNRLGESDQPLLNRRGEQLVGQVFPLDQAIVDGRGRLKIGDAFWVAEGPDLPQGTRVRVLAVRSMALQVQPAE